MEPNANLERLKRMMRDRPQDDGTDDESYTAASFGRVGNRPQISVTFRHRTGNSKTFSYSHLYAMDYNPSQGIVLHFTLHRVDILGRNLDQLHHQLCLHRAHLIQEADDLQAQFLPAEAAVITGLSIVALKEFIEI